MTRPPATRKRLPLAERRAIVVEAAGRLFGERGYDATTLDDVAAASGVTKPIVYRHFDSKRELYLALLERHRDDLVGFAALMPAEGSLDDRLRVVIEAWLAYVEAHAYAWQMLFRDSGGDAEVQAFRREVHARARAVIAELVVSLSASAIEGDELDAVAELVSMGMAALVLWWMDNPNVARATIVDAIARVWTGLLSGSHAGPAARSRD